MSAFRTYGVAFLLLILKSSAFTQKQSELTENQKIWLLTTYMNADKERLLGNHQEAFKLYSLCLTVDPYNSAVYYEMGNIYTNQKQPTLAELQYVKATSLDPDNKWYQESYIESLVDQQKYKEAAKAYNKLRSIDKSNVAYLMDQANLYLYTGKSNKAFKLYDQFEQLAGPSIDVGINKYKYCVSARQYKTAEEVLFKLIERFPEEVSVYANLADLYKAQRKYKEAMDIYRIAKSKEPNNPYILLSMAEFFDRSSQRDSAFTYLRKSFLNSDLDIDTKIGILLQLYGESQQDQKVRQSSIELCHILEKTHPQEAKSFSVSGDFLYLDDKLAEARLAYKEAVKLDPSKFAVWSQLLLIDSELERYDDLLMDSEAALELFPSQPGIYLFNGLAYIRQKNYQSASRQLKLGAQMVLGNSGLSSQLLANLGDAYHELNKNESSDSAYQAALSYDPNNLYVLNNYAYFLSLRNERLDHALQMSQTTVERAPRNASYLDTYGWILYQMKNYQKAETFIKRALENGGEASGEVLEHYGDILYRLNRKIEAVVYWKKAKDTSDESEAIDLKIEKGLADDE